MRPTILIIVAATGCAAARPSVAPDLPPLQLAAAPSAPAPLQQDYFIRDRGTLTESELKTVLDAPVYLEAGARVGVVPVAEGYHADPDLPLPSVPGELTRALGESGLYEAATELSTDWPAEGGLAGLRELAARYRVDYLILYRHRFTTDTFANGWAWLAPTGVGAMVAPLQTLEAHAVLEATLFDVRSGTLLFTIYARGARTRPATIWNTERKLRDLEDELLAEAAGHLADDVVLQSRRLAALRPVNALDQGRAEATLPSS